MSKLRDTRRVVMGAGVFERCMRFLYWAETHHTGIGYQHCTEIMTVFEVSRATAYRWIGAYLNLPSAVVKANKRLAEQMGVAA